VKKQKTFLSFVIATLILSACAPGASTQTLVPVTLTPSSTQEEEFSRISQPTADKLEPTRKPKSRTRQPNPNAAGTREPSSKQNNSRNPLPVATSANPDILASEILVNPTDTSVSISVVPAKEMTIFYEYGMTSGNYTARTASQKGSADVPLETLITGLDANTRYFYRLRYDGINGTEHSFITQRAPGSSFVFAIQADSHLNTDMHCNPDLYKLTMQNIAASQPDFLIDLGDTFRTDKLNDINPETIKQTYLDQRQYFGMVSDSAPLFLVNGNHEMEWGWLLDGDPENPAVWSAQARNAYFPQPSPGDFYLGDTKTVDEVGQLHDYYSWTWGEALFVAIDPYWSTTTDPKQSGNRWDWTLGEEQYKWFRETLENSNSKYKFVFTHHVLGETRGGVSEAPFFEWGGKNKDGSWGFDEERPGWGKPIHQMMVENGVTIFFQGHDHLFAREELDGVVYQTVPMPADDSYETPNAEFYPFAITKPESGYVRVSVAPEGITVDYIRSFLPIDESSNQKNGMADYSYTISP
jgi:hypothetical protein